MAVVIHFDGSVDSQQQRNLLRASVAALDGEHYVLLWLNEICDAGETFDLTGIANFIKPQQDVMLTIKRRDGSTQQVALLLRIDTPIEVDYYRHGGILPYVLRELVDRSV